ncbi:hypothetical protein STEG23_032863, partial [Scotinomys teguina]
NAVRLVELPYTNVSHMNLPTFPVTVHLLSLYGEQGSNRAEVAFKRSFSALPVQ